MPKNDEGEFELVLGNKQLLSVFFIVVVLLGVFFAMGYIAGRNTVPGTKEVATSQPIIVEAGPAGDLSRLAPRRSSSRPQNRPPGKRSSARSLPRPSLSQRAKRNPRSLPGNRRSPLPPRAPNRRPVLTCR